MNKPQHSKEELLEQVNKEIDEMAPLLLEAMDEIMESRRKLEELEELEKFGL